MSGAAILAELQAGVAARLGVAPAEVDPDGQILDELGLESREVVSFLIEIEERYPPVTFEEVEAAELSSLRQLADFIAARRPDV
jgi:acyl carrier protein